MTENESEVESELQPELIEPSTPLLKPWWLGTLAMVFLALWIWREVGIRVAKENAISQQAQIDSLELENDRLTQQADRAASELAALASGDTRTIGLTGAQSSSGKVFVDAGHHRLVAFFYKLPRNANDKTYQLWIVGADPTKPASGGVFDVTRTGNASMVVENLPADAKTIGITLEPKGGSAAPSTTEFVLRGEL